MIAEPFFTKTGHAISFRPAVLLKEGNCEWDLYRIIASVNGDEAGYLKISFVPKSTFDGMTIFHYLRLMGKCFSMRERSTPIADFSNEELFNFVKSVSWICFSDDMSRQKVAWPRDEMLKWITAAAQRLLIKHKKELSDFKRFHVDKPVVDYIHVEREFRRKGIGQALYFKGALWAAERKLHLHASGMQTDPAAASWRKLEALGLVKTKYRGKDLRRYLDITG